MGLRVGQINAQRSAAAAANLELLIKEKGLDIVCIQEPFCYKGKVRGYNSPNLIKITPQNCGHPWVAAVVNKERVEVLLNVGDENEHILCFKVMTGDTEFVLINLYCQYSAPLEGFLDKLQSLISGFPAERILIMMDANAKSSLWHAETTDEKGALLEEFISENNLAILNRPHNPPTYMSTRGQSNIDLTLSTENFMSSFRSWKVDCSCTTSDHNLIIVELEKGNSNNHNWKADSGYNIKKADWQKFRDQIDLNFRDDTVEQIGTLPADRAVGLFNKKLEACCQKAIPRRKVSDRAVPWWSRELTDMRKEVTMAKKQLIRARKLHLTEVLSDYTEMYKKLRNRYVMKIRNAKKETWQEFVRVEGNKDPWGIVYRIVREKFNKQSFWTALKLPDGRITTSIDETVQALLTKCVPKEDGMESEESEEMKKKIRLYKNQNLERPITFEEIKTIIGKCKNNKAPGLDNFKIEVIRELWKYSPQILINLYNNCFIQKQFPKVWKESNLKIIPKDDKRDRRLLNSYRPIALLSVVGKVYEKVIVQRIQKMYEEQGLESSKQFGFKKGKGADDAFLNLKETILSNDQRYAVALFVDIEGAFDNLWWPAVLTRVIDANCSTHMLSIVKNYFKHRKVIIGHMSKKYNRKMEKGCPQGSILGPAAWVWCMDALLKELETSIPEEHVGITAYADDLACVIKGNTRVEITRQADKVMEIINKWCRIHRLKISASKTVAMLVKGNMDERHLPTIKIDGKNVKYVENSKYLGVIIDKRMNFIAHARYLRAKVSQFVFSIKRVAAERWGIKSNILKVLYGAVALPITRYGAVLWYNAANKTMVKRNLLALQRMLLLLISKACRTTSTAALQTILGVKPMDLEIVEDALIKRIRRNLNTKWESYTYMEREQDQFHEVISAEIAKVRAQVIKEWQIRWENEMHGRETFEYIKDVSFVGTNSRWFKINRFLTYIITGYGPINSTLNKRGLAETNICPSCKQAEETTDHIIFDCPVYQDIRSEDVVACRNEKKNLIRNEQMLAKFNEFARSVFDVRTRAITNDNESRGSASPGQGRATADEMSDG